MEEATPTPPTPGKPTPEVAPSSKKRGIFIIAGIAAFVVLASFFFYNTSSNKNVPDSPKKPEPAFHRDEPTVPQIMQPDYKQKVREMLDSGKSVMEISKETKIRIDEVRNIKKDYKKEKAGK
jgi:hypothetical protein